MGYTRFTENAESWNQIQHHEIACETPDAVLGQFRQGEPVHPLAVVELKGPEVHLDRDRSNGRTGVQLCWDYLDNTPAECRWGVILLERAPHIPLAERLEPVDGVNFAHRGAVCIIIVPKVPFASTRWVPRCNTFDNSGSRCSSAA